MHSKNPNCFNCIFFTVTWEPKYPKACKFFGIKGTRLPSVVVFNSTGEPCKAFTKKT
ncbi:MAG: uracil-DNA glycosylase [Oscillospiraceae bacterium]|nr:uracil-DNA glycosylase [Oscillospiraceae bacterium]